MISAVLIGLGQVAWKFDEEPGRKVAWSHLGAYHALSDEIAVMGGYDPSDTAREAFSRRHPDIPVFTDIGEMMRHCKPEIISICAPNGQHHAALKEAFAAHVPRAVWCEKPMATTVEHARDMAETCNRHGTILIVSYVRRWHPLWRRFKDRLESGEIGEIQSLRIAMPNRLWTIGSHAVDLLCWLGGPVSHMQAMPVPKLEQSGEPAVSAMLLFENGASGHLQISGMRENLLVEAEAIGTEGRLICREGPGIITAEAYAESTRYDGYRELGEPTQEAIEVPPSHSPFVAIAREIADLLSGRISEGSCTPDSALLVQSLLQTMSEAASGERPAGYSI